MSDCVDGKYDCSTHGLLADMFEILQRLLNFTLKVHMADSWGAAPAYGSYKTGDATFVGVMGSVVNGTSELGLSAWAPSFERSN